MASVPSYEVIDGVEEVSWLFDAGNTDFLGTGVETPGFESKALILHAMWEHPEGHGHVSVDEAEKMAISRGGIEPLIIGDVNVSERSVATGIPIGATSRPVGWKRIRWTELAHRWGVELALDLSVLPISCFQSRLKSGSWPAGILPPPAGSLDSETHAALLGILKPYTGEQDVFNYSAPASWYGPHAGDGSPPLAVGPIESMLDLYQDSLHSGSGQNWWPADHSWLVYTDWDLTHTIVLGSNDAISAVINEPTIESELLTSQSHP
jgi:hypothetical protein